MTNDLEEFVEAAASLADQRDYHARSEEELERLGGQALLDCAAVYAALGTEARGRFVISIAEHLAAIGILLQQRQTQKDCRAI